MAMFTFASASASPFVTTTTVGLALSWPRPVTLVEADPTGGSSILAGYFKGAVNQPGLIHLAMAQRQGRLAEALPGLLLPIEGTNARVLAGTRSHDQAAGVEDLWEPLLAVLRSLAATGQDVIVDAGRLGLEGSPLPLVFGADVAVLMTSATLPAVSAARSWAATLRSGAAAACGVVVVGERRPYSAKEIAAALELPSLGEVAWAPREAQVFSDGEPYPTPRGLARLTGQTGEQAFSRSPYHRSLLALRDAVQQAAASATADPSVGRTRTIQEATR